MAEKKDTKQIAVRVDPAVVRKARFYLDEEHKTLQEFLCDYITAYVDQRDQERSCPAARISA